MSVKGKQSSIGLLISGVTLVVGCGGDPDSVATGGTSTLAMGSSAGMPGENLAGAGGGPAPALPPANSADGGATAGGAGGATVSGGGSAGGEGADAAGGGGGADGGSGGIADPAIPATFETVKFVLQGTNPPCVASDCHGSGTHHALSLAVDDQLHSTLTTHVSAACGDLPLVTPGDPQQSALLSILRGPCGEIPRMPNGCVEDEFGSTCVPDEYIAAIEEWIAGGAPQ